jgi:hypothetical protein
VSSYCCICLKTVEEHATIVTIGKVSACYEHIRQAVAQSDGPQLTDAEWQDFARKLYAALLPLCTE